MRISQRTIVILGLLIALTIIFSRFLSIQVWNVKVGFTFLPIAVAGCLFGPIPAALVAGVADFVGAILFPVGVYFPGFTVTAVLDGLVMGYFLHSRVTMARIVAAVFISQLVLSAGLNTLWIALLYNVSYQVLLVPRLMQATLLIVVKFFTLKVLVQWLPRINLKHIG